MQNETAESGCAYRFLCEGNKKTETVRKPDGMCHRQGFVGLNRDNLQIKFGIWGIDAPEKETGFWDKNQGLFVSPYFLGKILLLMFKTRWLE